MVNGTEADCEDIRDTMASKLLLFALVGSLGVSLVSSFSAAPCSNLRPANLANRRAQFVRCADDSANTRSLRMSDQVLAQLEERIIQQQQGLTLRRGFLSVMAAGFLSAKAASAAEDKGEGKKGGQASSSSSSEQGGTALGCDTPKPKPGEPELCETDY